MASISYLETLKNLGNRTNIMIGIIKEFESTTDDRKIVIKQYSCIVPIENIDTEKKLLTQLQEHRGIARLAKCPVLLEERQLSLEYAKHGDFFMFLEKLRDKKLEPFLTRRHVHQIFDQLLNAVNCISFINYVHRDIKPENILIYSYDERNIELGLADFELAILRGRQSEVVGTEQYISPYIKKKVRHTYNGSEDLYSLGTTLVLFMQFVDKTDFAKERAMANRIRTSTLPMLGNIIIDFKILMQQESVNDPIQKINVI